jgi:hypothetical protein
MRIKAFDHGLIAVGVQIIAHRILMSVFMYLITNANGALLCRTGVMSSQSPQTATSALHR